jgi:hypothetical protein
LLELYAEESDLVSGNSGATRVAMGARLGCHADSVEARYIGAELQFPPTEEELAELDDDG